MVGKATTYLVWSETTTLDSVANLSLCPIDATMPSRGHPRRRPAEPAGQRVAMKYAELLKAIDATSQRLVGRAAAAVNQALVIRNWLIGAYIVEFEQHGEDRTRYGQRLYARFATDLHARDAQGCGERMLQQMAQFYRVYAQFGPGIPQPVGAELQKLASIIFGKPLTAAGDVKKSSPAVRISAGSPIP